MYIYECVCALVWPYLPALFAEVYLLSTPECLYGYIYMWVTVHMFLEVGQRQWLCTKRGGVFEGGNSQLILCLPVADSFPLYFLYGVENERCMHLLQWYTCCCMNILGKGRPPPEREYSSLDQGQHTIPAPPTSVVFGMQRAGEGKSLVR